jgi:hypothetical protein
MGTEAAALTGFVAHTRANSGMRLEADRWSRRG